MRSFDTATMRGPIALQADQTSRVERYLPLVLFCLALAFVSAALLLEMLDLSFAADVFLVSTTVLVLFRLLLEIASKIRRREFGLDLIAALAMGCAIWFSQYLAGAIVAVMYAGGHFLEFYAHRRAESGMTDLLSRVPRTAQLISDATVIEIPIGAVAVGDRLLIRCGDVVPVDGTVDGRTALLDLSALTGEPLPVRLIQGQMVPSGASNSGDAFELIASKTAEASTYAHILRFVQQAKQSRAPIYRVADKLGIWFLGLTLLVSSVAVAASGEGVRFLAVLVVATPCPLILAVPVALVAGTSKAARRGILVKGASVIEALCTVDIVVFDKTGTLTLGEPVVANIVCTGDPHELLRLAGSAELASSHPLGKAIVAEARRRGLSLSKPEQSTEVAGEGIEALIENRHVLIGGPAFLRSKGVEPDMSIADVSSSAFVHAEGGPLGAIIFEDPLRTDAGESIGKLRDLGLKRILLASGDRLDVAKAIGDRLQMDAVKADLSAADKVEIVRNEKGGGRVMMVGDGVNDAPALAAADVGMAIARGNLAAAAEAADVVLLQGGVSGVANTLEIARRSKNIALQSVGVGIGLSTIAMIVAGAGFLPPVQGALIQEAIDVAVVLNALRALI